METMLHGIIAIAGRLRPNQELLSREFSGQARLSLEVFEEQLDRLKGPLIDPTLVIGRAQRAMSMLGFWKIKGVDYKKAKKPDTSLEKNEEPKD